MDLLKTKRKTKDLTVSSIAEFDDESNVIDFLEYLKMKRDKELKLMATHLVIGDPHCTPKANNDRFLWAGRLAADYKVTHVICMGDF